MRKGLEAILVPVGQQRPKGMVCQVTGTCLLVEQGPAVHVLQRGRAAVRVYVTTPNTDETMDKHLPAGRTCRARGPGCLVDTAGFHAAPRPAPRPPCPPRLGSSVSQSSLQEGGQVGQTPYVNLIGYTRARPSSAHMPGAQGPDVCVDLCHANPGEALPTP